MKGFRFRRRLGAYHDGALESSGRAHVERTLARDPQAESQLKRLEKLSVAVRDAWEAGPAAPDPDRLIATLRPALQRIDAELEDAPATWGWGRLADVFRPAPARVLAGAALAALLVVGVLPWLGGSNSGVQPSTEAGLLAPSVAALRAPETIYDLEQGDVPVMVFEAEDGATVVWMLDEDPDLISHGPLAWGNV